MKYIVHYTSYNFNPQQLKEMKKIITSICLGMVAMGSAQVIIGGTSGTATNQTSVLLDFKPGENKGIILPYVRTMASTPTTSVEPGTILVDASTATSSAVKYYAPGNTLADANGWVDLSSGNKANLTSPTDYMAKQPTAAQVTEQTGARAIIGAETSTAKGGVLVLESTTKAMVLPQVASTDDVINPAPGMMVYVNGATNKRLAVFNGAKWTFWAP